MSGFTTPVARIFSLRVAACCLLSAGLVMAVDAKAQVVEEAEAPPPPSPDHIVVGAGLGVVPTYQGSSDFRVLPLPAIDIRQGWFVASMFNGVGVVLDPSDNVSITGGIGFVQGYRKRDVPQGIDSLSDAAGMRFTFNLREKGMMATVGVTRSMGVTDGTVVDASLGYPIRVGAKLTVIPSIGTSWADRRYTDGYFGVSSIEASRSGLAAFSAGAGFKDVGGGVAANYRLTPRWAVTASTRVTHLLGDAADSPIVDSRTNVSGIFAISYRFGALPGGR
jgi:MipA family protein